MACAARCKRLAEGDHWSAGTSSLSACKNGSLPVVLPVCIWSNHNAASCKRLRIRSRNSAVAASVNVITKIWRGSSPALSGRPWPITRRTYKAANVHVLPVPALASMTCRPVKGMRNGFKVFMWSLAPPLARLFDSSAAWGHTHVRPASQTNPDPCLQTG